MSTAPTSRNKSTSPPTRPGGSDASSPSASLIAASSASEVHHKGVGCIHLILFFAAVSGCLLWTLWLLFLTVDPKGTINRIMRTESYDDGSFWLLIEPALSLVLFGVTGLGLVASGYLYLLVKIARARKAAPIQVVPSAGASSRVESMARRVSSMQATLHASVVHAAEDPAQSFVVKSVAKITTEILTSTDSTARKKAASIVYSFVALFYQLSLAF